MKEIVFNEDDYPVESIVITDVKPPFPKSAIYYLIGLLFEAEDGLSREEIEAGKKQYIGEVKTPVIADNERVVLSGLFMAERHHELDVLHVLSYDDIIKLNEAKIIDMTESKGFIKSLFSSNDETVFIFLKEDDLTVREYINLHHSKNEDCDNLIKSQSDKGFLPYFMDSFNNVKTMLKEMQAAVQGGIYFPDFYFSNPAQNILFRQKNKNMDKTLFDDLKFQKEMAEINIDFEERDAAESFDNRPVDTYNRITGYKYLK